MSDISLPFMSHSPSERIGRVISDNDRLPSAEELLAEQHRWSKIVSGLKRIVGLGLAKAYHEQDPDDDFILPGDALMLASGHLPDSTEKVVAPQVEEAAPIQWTVHRRQPIHPTTHVA